MVSLNPTPAPGACTEGCRSSSTLPGYVSAEVCILVMHPVRHSPDFPQDIRSHDRRCVSKAAGCRQPHVLRGGDRYGRTRCVPCAIPLLPLFVHHRHCTEEYATLRDQWVRYDSPLSRFVFDPTLYAGRARALSWSIRSHRGRHLIGSTSSDRRC